MSFSEFWFYRTCFMTWKIKHKRIKKLIELSILNFVIWKMSNGSIFCLKSLSRVIQSEQSDQTTQPHLSWIVNMDALKSSISIFLLFPLSWRYQSSFQSNDDFSPNHSLHLDHRCRLLWLVGGDEEAGLQTLEQRLPQVKHTAHQILTPWNMLYLLLLVTK